jgi:hypothetical protein
VADVLAVDEADMHRLTTLLVFLLSLTLVARADAPVDPAAHWSESTARLAGLFDGTVDATALANLVDSTTTLQAFDRDRVESARMLLERVSPREVLSVRSYVHPPVSAASDLVEDLKKAPHLPAPIAEEMLIDEPHALRGADGTMARWFGLTLDAEEGDPVAMIALLDDGAADIASGRVAKEPRLVLLLIKGKVQDDGTTRIVRVQYGDTQQATK